MMQPQTQLLNSTPYATELQMGGKISAGDVGLALFLSGVIILSVGGNILVCVSVCTDRQLRKRNNSLYVSLAVADTMLSAVVMPFAAVHEITEVWDLGRFFCRVWQSMDVMCCTSSILHITLIAFDRYMHIRDPFHYNEIMSCRIFCFIIIGIWLFSGLISFIPILLGVHEAERPSAPLLIANSTLAENENDCILELNATYAVLSSCASFFLPSLFMVGLYIRLYIYARRQVSLIKVSTPILAQNMGVDEGTSSTFRRRSADHKAAITVGVIMGTFLFCWVPFFTFNVIGSVCKTCIPGIVIKVTIWLGYFNSCMNPLIYTLFNMEFRNAFRKILCRKMKRFPSNFGNGNQSAVVGKENSSGFYSNVHSTARTALLTADKSKSPIIAAKQQRCFHNTHHQSSSDETDSKSRLSEERACAKALLHNRENQDEEAKRKVRRDKAAHTSNGVANPDSETLL